MLISLEKANDAFVTAHVLLNMQCTVAFASFTLVLWLNYYCR